MCMRYSKHNEDHHLNLEESLLSSKFLLQVYQYILPRLELLAPIRRGIVNMKGEAYVGDKLVCESEMMASIIKRDKKKEKV